MLPRYLPAAQVLKPLQQGSLASLCGLYSIINGIELAALPHYKLRPKHRIQLYARGITTLSKTRRLSAILQAGMSEQLWHELRDALLDEALKVVGCRLRSLEVFTGSWDLANWNALKPIRRSLYRHGPVLVNLRGTYNHFTVIVGWIDTRIILFDSAGMQWIQSTKTGIQHRGSTRRHQIRAKSAFTLMLDDRG